MIIKPTKLSEICSFTTGKLNSNAAIPNGIYPFFTCAQETYQINTAAYNTECVLLGGNNANGVYPLKYYKGEFNAYQRTYIIEARNKESLNIRFLYYALRPALGLFQKQSIGAATQYLTKPILDNFIIKLPLDIKVQTHIADILSCYDDLIENNNHQIKLLEESARLLYQEWFVHLRFPGHEQLKVIDGIPEGWRSGTIGDFFETSSGGTPSRKNPGYYDGGIINWVKTQELNGCFIFSSDEKITEIGLNNSSAKVFPIDSLLVAMYGATIGQIGVLAVPAATNQACCAILPKEGTRSLPFLYCYFEQIKNELVGLSKGAAQNNVSQAIIKTLHILLPTQAILDFFSVRASPLFDKKRNLEYQNQKLSVARDLLLPRLMSGALEV